MMTKSSLLSAGGSSAPGGVFTELPDEQSAAPAPGARDFSSVLSQNFADRTHHSTTGKSAQSPLPANLQPDKPADSAAKPNPKDPFAAKTSADDSSTDDSADDKPAPNDSAPKTAEMDASVASTLLALMAQFAKPDVDPRRAVALTQSGLKGIAGEGQSTSAGDGLVPGKALVALSATPPGPLISLLDAKLQSAASPDGKTLPTNPKTAATAANAPPADIALPAKEPEAASVASAASPPQPVVDKLTAAQLAVVNPDNSPDGTGVALSKYRMKFTDEKTEITGRNGQKLPRAVSGVVASAKSADTMTVESDTHSPLSKSDAFESALAMDFAAKLNALDFESSGGLTLPQVVDHSASQVERVAQLVNQEVVSMRQSGANTLAVSLKLDAHTELFLQLTNHGGQIQASLRCERGNLSGLEGHWADLQESLARQNVTLQPFEVAASSSASAFNSATQNQQRETRELPQEAAAPVMVKTTAATKSKTKTTSRQGWESWA